MRWNKLLAMALALAVLVTGTGVFACAQSTDSLATPTEVSGGEGAVPEGPQPSGDEAPVLPEGVGSNEANSADPESDDPAADDNGP